MKCFRFDNKIASTFATVFIIRICSMKFQYLWKEKLIFMILLTGLPGFILQVFNSVQKVHQIWSKMLLVKHFIQKYVQTTVCEWLKSLLFTLKLYGICVLKIWYDTHIGAHFHISAMKHYDKKYWLYLFIIHSTLFSTAANKFVVSVLTHFSNYNDKI